MCHSERSEESGSWWFSKGGQILRFAQDDMPRYSSGFWLPASGFRGIHMSFLWYWPTGGWDVDKWKKSHPWEPIHSEQSEHKELIPITWSGMSRDQWETQRARWKKISDQIVGEVSDKPASPMKWEFLNDAFERGGENPIIMRRLRYQLTNEEWGYAWLLTPKDDRKIRPAVIALHQTAMQGKNEVVGIENIPGDPGGVSYGLYVAQAGFTVLAPDAIAFGERAAEHSNAFYRSADDFYAKQPNGSVMAKMCYDVSRAIDLLEQMPEIDKNRIGCIGHSHGAYGTIFAAIYDPRIKAAVVSCGFTTLRTDPKPERWWRLTSLMPRLGFYEGHMEQTPIDYHIWLSLIAPRPLFISAGLKDQIFPETDNIPKIMEMLKGVWDLYGTGDKLRSNIFAGPHDFPKDSRARAIEMLKETLGT
jgi:dienelactone hydrolase